MLPALPSFLRRSHLRWTRSCKYKLVQFTSRSLAAASHVARGGSRQPRPTISRRRRRRRQPPSHLCSIWGRIYAAASRAVVTLLCAPISSPPARPPACPPSWAGQPNGWMDGRSVGQADRRPVGINVLDARPAPDRTDTTSRFLPPLARFAIAPRLQPPTRPQQQQQLELIPHSSTRDNKLGPGATWLV